MGEQKRHSTERAEREPVESAEVDPQVRADAEEKKAEIDELLDEIDEVLEENAEDFVRNYVQKGGQ